MLLCLDIGNSHIHGGIFDGETLCQQFRYSTQSNSTSDQMGVFFRSVIRENNIEIDEIKHVAIASVVPSMDYSIGSAFIKYFNVEPFFLQPGAKTGLKIKTRNPLEIGADRIANAIAVMELFENKNVAVVDFGTATTVELINKDREYLGGSIMPGLKIAMEVLSTHTAKLFPVNIVKPKTMIGNDTVTNIQAGLYYGHLGAINTFIDNIRQLTNDDVTIVGTGGFASMYQEEDLFTTIIPDLALQGLRIAWQKNHK